MLQRYSALSHDIAGSRLKKSMSPGGGITEQLDAVFDRRGPLGAKIPEYRVRSQQLEMANRASQAIRENAGLVCEAGTGTGKTFAYLGPARVAPRQATPLAGT